MQTFSAVRTTGIYCRPECAGRPHPSNVEEYGLAAAAEAAGYRACLRCRPYRGPEAVSWEGPELVCRAVQLILGGTLDEGSEGALGARIGVSPRHLRRLFTTHLGVTPDELARSRRSHFARRLLDDTDLSITDVAFAAGFGSVRQLNRSCLGVFHATPRELRARRRRSDRLVADGGLSLRLPFRGPLDWASTTAYLQARAIPGVEHVRGDVYRRTIVADGDTGVLELMPETGGTGAGNLILRAHLPHWEGLIHIVDRARRIPGIDADLDDAARHLAGDPLIGPLLAARPGIRVPGTWDGFETGVRAIIGQQVSVGGGTTIAGRLVERAGLPVPGLRQMGLTHTFPAPADLAEADLEGIGLTGKRQDAIRHFSQLVAADQIRLDRSVGLQQLVDSLEAVPGLGGWTAHYIALRLGERDAFPAADLGLRRGVDRANPPAAGRLAEMSKAWSPWRSLAAAHLWMATTAGHPHPGAPGPQPVVSGSGSAPVSQ
jgi:AraC family transcriptional regulator of adaptative response / DNA-3-methyladenine glycosylase II